MEANCRIKSELRSTLHWNVVIRDWSSNEDDCNVERSKVTPNIISPTSSSILLPQTLTEILRHVEVVPQDEIS